MTPIRPAAVIGIVVMLAQPAGAQTQAAPPPAPAAAAPAAAAVFPGKIDPKYASLKPGAGRRKTCDDQYKANKASGANAGLKWGGKGGYYSQCSKHLKAV
jgi:hypothetical protein